VIFLEKGFQGFSDVEDFAFLVSLDCDFLHRFCVFDEVDC